MRILIDTNILIALEDNTVIADNFAKFYRIAITNKCNVLYHPKAIPIDIQRDKDVERKKIILSKLKKYEPLKDYVLPTSEFLSTIKNKKINDEIDNVQLFQLYKGFVDLFVTQDQGIRKNTFQMLTYLKGDDHIFSQISRS